MARIKLPEHKVQELKEVCSQYNHDKGELINVLHSAQGIFGYLPAEVQEVVAQELDVSIAHVYGVVTFYSFFSMLPKGEHPISICMGTACYVRGGKRIVDRLEEELGISVGESTPDGKFSIIITRCLGACGLAPVVMIGEEVFQQVNPDKVEKILAKY